ncbi:carcinoembryonic antigen-related cell adhesion molecule 5-like isoform X2 [Dromaius novaehollandiae]
MGRRAPSPGPPRSAVLLAAAVLGSCLQPVLGQATAFAILRDPDPATVGGNVTFTLQPTPSNVVMCVWYRASDTVHSSEILSYVPSYNPPQSNGTAFTGRETGGPGCSMHIRDLWMNDTSVYTVQIWNPGSATASTNLTVYAPLPQPSVTPQNVTVTENGTFSLTCDPPASTETLLWLRDGVLLAAGGRLALSDDNRTLTVTPAARTDAGAYVCEARNPVSSNRSEAANVTVAYGPDAVTIEPPGPLEWPAGSALALRCLADAVPDPLYTWFSGNATHTGATWAWESLSPAQQGTYVCQAQNPYSGQSLNSSVLELRVWELLLQPSVMPQNVTVTENGTFSLTCDPPASTETLLWLRDGVLLAAGGRLALSDDNRTLTVTPAARTDAGAYVCEARNPVSSNRSEATNVTVAYGPDAAAISPPSPVRVPLGSRVELACVADAVPSPRYAWTFGNTTLGRESLLVFVFRNATQAGEYRCVATNPALGRAAAAALLLQTPQPGLSAGAVAGIVVGTLLGLVLLGAAGYLLWRRKRGSPQRGGGGPGAAAPHPPPAAAHPPHELPSANGSPGTEEDIKYSTLAFRDGAAPRDTAPGPPCDSSTIYSEVKQT